MLQRLVAGDFCPGISCDCVRTEPALACMLCVRAVHSSRTLVELIGNIHERLLRVLLLCSITSSLQQDLQHASRVSCSFNWKDPILEPLNLAGALRCRLSSP